jgi:hypothetical protein
MGKATTRGLLLAVAMLTASAAAATPAHAAITPARTRISFTSTNTVFTFDPTFGLRITCPTAEFTATTDDAGTSMSGRLTFSGNTTSRVTCTDGGATSVSWSCPGLIGASDTTSTSVARTSTSGDLVLSGSPVCSLANFISGVTVNIDAQTVSSCVTIRENTTIDINCTLRVTTRAARRSGTAVFTGTFTTATNISIS